QGEGEPARGRHARAAGGRQPRSRRARRRPRDRWRQRDVRRAPDAAQSQRPHPGGGQMPHPVLLNASGLLRGLLVAATALLLGAAPVAEAAKALVNVEVPAGKWKGAKLKNLPKDARVAVSVETSGSLDVILIHIDELKRFPAAVNPEF